LAARTSARYDRIVIDPLFSVERWKEHLDAAADLLKRNGLLMATLSANTKHAGLLPSRDLEWWPRQLANELAGTSILVEMLTTFACALILYKAKRGVRTGRVYTFWADSHALLI